MVGTSGPVLAKALQDGTIQAYAASSNDFTAIQMAGVSLKRFEPTELSQNPANSWVVWKPTLEEKRPMIQGFLRAWAKGQHSVLLDTKAVISACKKRVPEQFEDAAAGERRIMINGFTQQLRRTVEYGEAAGRDLGASSGRLSEGRGNHGAGRSGKIPRLLLHRRREHLHH